MLLEAVIIGGVRFRALSSDLFISAIDRAMTDFRRNKNLTERELFGAFGTLNSTLQALTVATTGKLPEQAPAQMVREPVENAKFGATGLDQCRSMLEVTDGRPGQSHLDFSCHIEVQNDMIRYFDLSDDQFEKIVVAIGQRLFGAGLMGFAAGKDGGRDAKFTGTAEQYPSAAGPWTGCTIIQAKHTNGINASFSDPAVCNAEKLSGLICDEFPKIRALYESGEAQNYLLISNRKLSGITQPKLVKLLSEQTGMPIGNIALAGTQQLDDWLELFPDAKASLSINPLESPLIVNPDDLANIIEGFREAVAVATSDEDRSTPTPRTPLVEKNHLNNMTPDFEAALRRLYFELMRDIRKFLYDPINDRFKASYQEAVEEFNFKIIAKRTEYETFDDVFNYLLDLLIDRSGILRSNRRLTRAMLYYMYWNCDIGRDKDDQTV